MIKGQQAAGPQNRGRIREERLTRRENSCRAHEGQTDPILFWNESGFRADTVHGKTWGRPGQTPIVLRSRQRQAISAASAISAPGEFWFSTYNRGLNGELFVQVLRKLMRHRKRSFYLILDGLPAYKRLLVRDYIATTQGRLSLLFLPGHAPDVNRGQFVWSHIKRTGATRRPLQQGETLDKRIDEELAEIRANPRLVRSFFDDLLSVAYILDC